MPGLSYGRFLKSASDPSGVEKHFGVLDGTVSAFQSGPMGLTTNSLISSKGPCAVLRGATLRRLSVSRHPAGGGGPANFRVADDARIIASPYRNGDSR